MGSPIRLPHPELADIAARLNKRTYARRGTQVAGTYVTYFLFDPDPEVPDIAIYDEAGRILISRDLFELDPRIADLTAFHEHIEIETKRRGQPHHRAHRRALVEELLAAKDLSNGQAERRSYLEWRNGGYPAMKVPDPAGLTAALMDELGRERPRKGKLLQIITPYRV